MPRTDDTRLCACGCGTVIPARNPWNQPKRFVFGHSQRKSQPEWHEESTGYKTPCWLWGGGLNSYGYGRVMRNAKSVMIHRVFYEKHRGTISKGLVLDHLCGVKHCVNPDHLEAVTQAVNCRRSSGTKLDWAKVRKMRSLHAQGRSAYSLAKEFGVVLTTAVCVVRGQTWKE